MLSWVNPRFRILSRTREGSAGPPLKMYVYIERRHLHREWWGGESGEGHRVSGMMRENVTTLLLGFFLLQKQTVLVTESGKANP